MAAVKYLIRGKGNLSKITVQFSTGRSFSTKITTPLVINPKHFSVPLQKVKNIVEAGNKDEINKQLRKLREHILDNYNEAIAEGINIDTAWTKATVHNFFNYSPKKNKDWKIFLVDYCQYFIDHAGERYAKKIDQESTPITERTIQKYRTLKTRLTEFQDKEGQKIKLKEIALSFYNSFVAYLRTDCQYCDNTVGKYIGTLKTVLKDAMMNGIAITPQIKKFKVFTSSTKDVYLTDTEIDKIFNYDFNNLRLKNARDLFIIGLRTGLRVSDFTRLHEATIDGDFITMETLKQGNEVVIPLHPQVQAIMEAGMPHKISEQKLNDYIKEICKEVGFTEKVVGNKMNKKTKRKVRGMYPKYQLISTHTCRRSFASNLYGKIPNGAIMAITGHSKESTFLKYIKITSKENAIVLQLYWKKTMTDQGYKPSMRAI